MKRLVMALMFAATQLLPVVLDRIYAQEGASGNTPISEIVQATKTGPQKDRWKALDLLGRRQPRTPNEIDELRTLCKGEDKNIREEALRALGAVAEETPGLRAKYLDLLDDTDEQIQIIGLQAARKLKTKEAVPKAGELLRKRPRFHFNGRNPGGATSADILFAREVGQTLVELGDNSALDEILSRDELMAVESVGGWLVAKYGHKALPKTLNVARSNSNRKSGAVAAISKMKDPESAPDLLELTQDQDTAIACAATRALAGMARKLPNKVSVEARLNMMLDNPDRSCRAGAYLGLLSIDSKKYLAPTLEALTKPQMHVIRLEVLYWLIRNPMPEAIPYLEHMMHEDEKLNQNDSNYRREIARTIYKISGKRVPYKGLEQDLERQRQGIGPNPYESK